jgi:Tfp pilus assembly protein PilN
MKRKIPHPDIQPLLQYFQPGKKMLALEITGSQLIGAVAEAKGKKLSISNFVAIDRVNAGDDLPDPVNIQEIMDRLDYEGGAVVLVTSLARSVQITMNRAKVDKLRHHQLCDALRWEVEPYTGISGTQAMIGAEKGSPVEQENLMLLAEDEMDVDVNVSVIEQNVYRAMKQIFKRIRLKLIRLYPPEVCFFMPLFLEPPEGAQAVFDIGADYANFTIIKGRQPKQINTYPLGKDVLMELIDSRGQAGETEQSLAFLLHQVPGPLPLILTGVGATVPKIVDYLDELCEYGALPVELTRSDKLGKAAHEGMNAIYSIAAGAAVRELSGSVWRIIGITDAIPPALRIRQSVYLMPLGVAAFLAVALVGHYAYMKTSKERYKAQTIKLDAQIKEKKKKFEAYDKLNNDLGELKKKTGLTKKQITFLHGGSDDNLIHINRVLQSFLGLPMAMQLVSIQQEKEKYILKGIAEDFAVVGTFAVTLQQYPWCRVVDIKVLEKSNEGTLSFQIEMDTEPNISSTVVRQ